MANILWSLNVLASFEISSDLKETFRSSTGCAGGCGRRARGIKVELSLGYKMRHPQTRRWDGVKGTADGSRTRRTEASSSISGIMPEVTYAAEGPGGQCVHHASIEMDVIPGVV